MRIAAIICEFNPFHNGHKYLIDKVKSEHADCVIAIMSGSFVQRGDIAITDKFARAKAALANGCDLVVELPTVYSLSSAERFAKGGVELSKALNADILCFGAENNDIDKLTAVSDIFYDDDFKQSLKKHLSNGEYYPKAVSLSVEEILSQEYSEILNGPNNTLAIEYIKALKGSSISPVAIKRTGASHDSEKTSNNIASATHIRNLIRDNTAYDKFTQMRIDNHTDIKKLETAILYKLRTMSKEEIENLPDVAEGLHNRIYDCCRKSNSFIELLTSLKTKRYTLARLRRIVMFALLDITKKDTQQDIGYIRVLGMSDKGSKLLKNAKLPLVCNLADNYSLLNDNAKRMIDIDLKAYEVASLSSVDGFKNELQIRMLKK